METKITFISPRRDRIERRRQRLLVARRIIVALAGVAVIAWYWQQAPRAWSQAVEDQIRSDARIQLLIDTR